MLMKIRNVIILFVIAMLIISCQKELSFGDTIGAGTTTPCKTCSYIPFCNGASYTYIDTTAGTGTTSIQTISVVKDTTIDGKIFQKFSNPGSDGYYNCTSGISTIIAYQVPTSGGTVMKIEQIELKANEPVGATWSNTIINGIGQNVDYNYKIVAKGASKLVLGINYSDVIQVHLKTSITVPVLGTIVVGESDYFYANNIGLIDNINYTVIPSLPPIVSLHRVLKTYSIP